MGLFIVGLLLAFLAEYKKNNHNGVVRNAFGVGLETGKKLRD